MQPALLLSLSERAQRIPGLEEEAVIAPSLLVSALLRRHLLRSQPCPQQSLLAPPPRPAQEKVMKTRALDVSSDGLNSPRLLHIITSLHRFCNPYSAL